MINKNSFRDLRNAEYYQYMTSVRDILAKYPVVGESFGCLQDELSANLAIAETALAAERRSEKVREKNEADRYRDRLHSKLFNYLKMILYDERDPRFDDALAVMRVVKEAGNPTRMSENAQSALMTTLGNRLQPLRRQLEAIEAQTIVDQMMEANRQFIAIEKELREAIAAQKLDATPTSMAAARRLIDPIYRALIDAINGFANVPSKRDAFKELIAEMNVLTARYDAMMAARKREKKEKAAADGDTNVCDECKANNGVTE